MPAPEPPICSYEGSDYQSSFWERGGRDYEDQVEAIALRRLLPRGGGLLLELGAGAGRNTPRPRKVKTLESTIKALFQGQLTDAEMVEIRAALEKRGAISIVGDKVTYSLDA